MYSYGITGIMAGGPMAVFYKNNRFMKKITFVLALIIGVSMGASPVSAQTYQ